MQLVEFPGANLADVPARLRAFADEIERGDYGDSVQLAWVIRGDAIRVGILGQAAQPVETAHLLFTAGAQLLLEEVLNG